MPVLNESQWIVIVAATLLAVAAVAFVRLRNKKTPEEEERERRLQVNNAGRLTEGVLVESPYGQPASQTPELLFYRYSAAGVEYTAAQDISSLTSRIPSAFFRPGSITGVKYDPRRPSNSIIVCEQWSGLRVDSARAARANSL
jgi:hypothetical protein